jgi:hypothetical protein
MMIFTKCRYFEKYLFAQYSIEVHNYCRRIGFIRQPDNQKA